LLLSPLWLPSCSGGRSFHLEAPKRADEPYAALEQAEAPATPAADDSPTPGHNTERYAHIQENDFVRVADAPLSTFSIDVDTASYSNVRRFLKSGSRPPVDAVRIEELINYFDYDYPQPTGEHPFSVVTELAPAPWAMDHVLLHIGLKGRELDPQQIPGRNLVFLLDVSGSMEDANKLPLLKKAFGLMVEQLDERDRVAIAVYAGAAGVVLEPTPGNEREAILDALDELSSGGSTNGGAGIELAYQLAQANLIPGGVNRVILATDGDFNVGTTSEGSLTRLIEKKRELGIFLTVLGFGMWNLNDSTMEALADHGNGNYAYIDTIEEAQKVLVTELASTLVTIAKDTKLQLELNPARVESYRLIGYENRLLADRDFNDDTKDAGDLGAGHSVTAIYELVTRGQGEAETAPRIDRLKYQAKRDLSAAADSDELLTIKLRYKRPAEATSRLLSTTVSARDQAKSIATTSDDFRFSAAVAGFGMMLRDSKYRGELDWRMVITLAKGAQGEDRFGYRRELLSLIDKAERLR
jgi:Ca-activated chloride channel family protein